MTKQIGEDMLFIGMLITTQRVNKRDGCNLPVMLKLGIDPLFLDDHIECKRQHNHAQSQIDSSKQITESVLLKTPPGNDEIVSDHKRLILVQFFMSVIL